MKIFVSGQIKDLEYVRTVQDKLIEMGHEITHDWTNKLNGDLLLSGSEAKLKNIDETSRRAKTDIQGVIDCDTYIICTKNREYGKGMYVELGAALSLNVANGKPRIFLVGPMNHMSIFYFHPSVMRFDNIDEVFKILGKHPLISK